MATLPNYFLDGGAALPTNPFQSALTEGMHFGATIQDFQAAQQQRQQQQQDRELKLQQQQQALAAQESERQRIAGIRQKYQNVPASQMGIRDILDLQSTYDPAFLTATKETWSQLPEAKQKEQVKTIGTIGAAVRGGNIDAARNIIQQQIDGNKEQDPATSEQYKTLLDTLNQDPDGVFKTFVPLLSTMGKMGQDALNSILGAEKTGEETRKLAAEAGIKETEAKFTEKTILSDLEKKKWEVNNLRSQIARASAQTQIDRQRLALDAQQLVMNAAEKSSAVPEFAQKDINAAAVGAASATQSSAKYNSLAQRLEAAGGGFGSFTSANEWLKEATGSQSPRTLLLKEYEQLKNQGVLDALPTGPSTDTDIRIAQRGFLPANADAKELASFLRGMAKLKQVESNIANAKVDWLAQNKGQLTKPKTTIVVGNYTAKPGESFSDLSLRIATDTAKQFRSPSQIAEEQRQRSVAQIPTTGAAPAAPASNVRAQADAILGGAR